MKAVRDRFTLQGGTGDFPSYAVAGKGVILRRRGNHVVFLELRRILELRRDLRLPLGLALRSPIFPSSCEGKLGVALESLQSRRDRTRGVSGT